MFNENQLELLKQPPDPNAIKKRKAGRGRELSYIEGWWVIQQLNEIFGNGNWDHMVKDLKQVEREEIKVEGKTRKDVSYLALVLLKVWNRDDKDYPTTTTHEDIGFGIGQVYGGWGEAHESAAKEAVTDALKRCARVLGERLGNVLYDKEWLKDQDQAGDQQRGKSKDSPAQRFGKALKFFEGVGVKADDIREWLKIDGEKKKIPTEKELDALKRLAEAHKFFQSDALTAGDREILNWFIFEKLGAKTIQEIGKELGALRGDKTIYLETARTEYAKREKEEDADQDGVDF